MEREGRQEDLVEWKVGGYEQQAHEVSSACDPLVTDDAFWR